MNDPQKSVVVLGGGPGGYEAALVAAQLGATVTVVDRDGLGGASVLTDCVPSKALISTSDFLSRFTAARELGVGFHEAPGETAMAHMADVNARILDLAAAQSRDIGERLASDGVRVCRGVGRLTAPDLVHVECADGTEEDLAADVVLVATGSTPRVMDTARPDGERILTWQQIYALKELPTKLIVVGSGVTGAELAHAYLGLGSEVVLVSSRDRVLPGEDADAATVIENVFRRRGMQVMNRSRAAGVERTPDGVTVTLVDGRTVDGSHALLAVGSIPATAGLGLEEAGVDLRESGHLRVDRVSRTSRQGIYAAGDCTGVVPLASVAAMQGRIAMAHALGDAVAPLNRRAISANIFTDPEIATVGFSQKDIDEGVVEAQAVMLPLATNPRAKMQNVQDGFVKLFARTGTSIVVGGVVVSPRASELIFPVALAVQNRLTVDQLASTFTIYPSLSGSIAEAARKLHSLEED
ncbi:NAD(P)H-quinone dehydrogenase [Segeticoccus rhizosphaerae]|uniref:NAD(P)H-quinone dehydrogenase n=1 Tax=Segeticoccus rhizosphaerae TaxID=1104777 RepID=UPI0010C0EE2B|nr:MULTISPECIES: NAD(P)H-quinone dehydrogenase [Intrasporangiaceae]HEX5427513.1 NAD(P)H-quinone dehydrogenase [Pedococcus sp.]